ncbi:MAG TPA: ABC transporter permease [Anaerolineales bacterium]
MSKVALASLALIGAGLFLRSFRNATAIEPGIETRDITVSQFYLSASGYSGPEQRQFCRALRERMESVPGVVAAGYADQVPMGLGTMPVHALNIPGYAAAPDEDMNIGRMFISPGFPALLGIPLLDGRDFTKADDEKAPLVMLVNETFVRRFLHNGPAIGARVQVQGAWTRVVGVVRDSKYNSLTEGATPFFYIPFHQRFQPGLNFNYYIKSSGNQAVSTRTIKRISRAGQPCWRSNRPIWSLAQRTASAPSTLGMTIPSGRPVSAACKSSLSSPEPTALIRARRSARPKSRLRSASAIVSRASVLRLSATPSSMSMHTQSTPSVAALRIFFKSSPGM